MVSNTIDKKVSEISNLAKNNPLCEVNTGVEYMYNCLIRLLNRKVPKLARIKLLISNFRFCNK